MTTRVIKFRGVILDSEDKWRIGNHIQRGGRHFIETIFHEDEVIPETVGQFTGLLDSEFNEVYEGDIVRLPETEWHAEIIGVVVYDRGAFVLRSTSSDSTHDLGFVLRKRQPGQPAPVVIGNAYDNPELIEQKNSQMVKEREDVGLEIVK